MFDSLIAHLAHVEVTTPVPEASLAFYRDVIGLEESARDATSVYLRGWGEHHFHSLQLTEGPAPALGHIGWRTVSAEALEEAARRLEADGAGLGWEEPTTGHGRAYRFRGPSGHVHELFWEIDAYVAPPGMEPVLPSRPQRVVPRGVSARSIDHVTVNSFDPFGEAEWFRDTLGLRFMEYGVLDHDPSKTVAAFVTPHVNSHELGLILDFVGLRTEPRVEGRLNHIAYWLDTREEVLRSADVLIDAGFELEWGPARHGVGENTLLYVREPSGLRVELFSGGWVNAVPDWQPVCHTGARALSYWTPDIPWPDSFQDGFPMIDLPEPMGR